jgi:hypothetical protein
MNDGKMTRYVRQFKPIFLLLMAIVILFAACSEEETPTPQNEPQATVTAQEKTPTPQNEPQATATVSETTPASQSQPQGAAISPLASPLAAPQQSEPLQAPSGTTGMAGMVLSSAYQPAKILGTTPMRLAAVQWNKDHTDGIFILTGSRSPGTTSEADGRFLFADIPPGDYVIVVGEVIGTNEIFSKPDGKPYIFTVEKGKVTDVGTVTVNLQ